MISLLYKNNDNVRFVGQISYNGMGELLMNEVISNITPDTKCQRVAREIISHPLTDSSDVEYRQHILLDFISCPQLLNKLIEVSNQFMKFSKELKLIRSTVNKNNTDNNMCSISSSEYYLQSICFLSKKVLLVLKSINNELCVADCGSEGLLLLKKRMERLCNNACYARLLELASYFENYRFCETADDIFVKFSDIGKVETSLLCQAAEKNKKHKNNKTKSNYFLGTNIKSILIFNAEMGIAKSFENFVISIINEFQTISDELLFYDFAYKYYNIITIKSVPICFPTFSSETNITKLHDLFLSISTKNISVPNDFVLCNSTNGIIIWGENGCGKTVYLRSIATSYLFAQAGLPIPAESATISILSNMSIFFATKESEAFIGRFESEVMEMKRIIDTCERDGVVFLNEVFQSTNYFEGSNALYYILKYLSYKKVRWCVVTHLKELKDMFCDDDSILKIRFSATNKFQAHMA